MATAGAASVAGGRRERRRLAIIHAARALFLEKGYDAVTLTEIVRRSGGSLTTLYDLFENKAGLLSAIVADERFAGLERLEAIRHAARTPADTLRLVARTIHEDMTRPEVTGMMRIAMTESLRNSAFAHHIYTHAHLPLVELLGDMLEGWTRVGQARIGRPRLAAEFFLGLILHSAQTRALLGTPGQCGQEPVVSEATRLTEAVDMFVAAYDIATGPAAA